MSQKQRLLEAFLEKKDLMVYEIMAPRPEGLGIAQYNARIKELRELGHPIENIEPGHFRYQVPKEKKMQRPLLEGDGYQKFQAAGQRLKGSVKPKSEYESLTTRELRKRKEEAEVWLKNNTNHKLYAKALARYERICDELQSRDLGKD